jgi:MFS family permease
MSRRWIVLLTCILVQTLLFGISGGLVPLLVGAWSRQFASDTATIQAISSVILAFYCIASPFGGALMTRLSMRRIVAVGLLLLSTSLALTGLLAHSTLAVFLLFAFPVGAVFTLAGPLAAQTIVAQVFPERSGLPIGLVLTGSGIGLMFMPRVFAHLLDRYDWPRIFLGLALLVLLLCPLIIFLLKDTKPTGISTAVSPDPAMDEVMTIRKAFSNRTVLLIAMICMLGQFVSNGIYYNVPLLADYVGGGVSLGALGLSVVGACNMVGKATFGKMSDFLSSSLLMGVAQMLVLLSCLVLMLTHTSVGFLTAMVLFGIGSSGELPLQATLVRAHCSKRNFPRILGVTTSFMVVAALGPIIAGSVFDHWGNYVPYFSMSIGILVCAMIALSRLPAPGPGAGSPAGREDSEPTVIPGAS